MAFKPSQFEGVANEMLAIFDQMEIEILQQIRKDLDKNISNPQKTFKWEEMNRHRMQVQRILSAYRLEGSKALKRLSTRAYLTGLMGADTDLMNMGLNLPQGIATEIIGNTRFTDEFKIVGEFGKMHISAVSALASSFAGDIDRMLLQVSRREDDIFKNIIKEVSGLGVTGVNTRLQITQKALDKFCKNGIGAFTDKAGKVWDIGSYTQMATRTALVQASVQGHVNRLSEQGKDLVIVSSHQRACHLCRPWQRKILSISGEDEKYPPLQRAISAGLYHPNCGHTISAYIEGLTEIDDEDDGTSGLYKDQQRLREIERNIRKWKKRQQMAVDPKTQALTQRKIKEWQKKARELTESTGIPRKYSNEKVHKASLKDIPKKVPLDKKSISKKLQAIKKDLKDDKLDWKSTYKELTEEQIKAYNTHAHRESLSEEDRWAYDRYVRTSNSFNINKNLYTGQYRWDKNEYHEYLKELREEPKHSKEKIDSAVAKKLAKGEKYEDVMKWAKEQASLKKYDEERIQKRLSNFLAGTKIPQIDKISELINKYTIPEDMKVVRFVKGDVLKTIVESVGGDKNSDPTYLNKILSGVVWQNKGFTSVSYDINANVFTSHNIQMEIYVPKGTNGMITSNWVESEIVLDKGANFQIMAVEKRKNKIVLVMKMKGYGEV